MGTYYVHSNRAHQHLVSLVESSSTNIVHRNENIDPVPSCLTLIKGMQRIRTRKCGSMKFCDMLSK